MSFAASVAALRTLFGVPDDAPLLEAIQVMNISMGIVGEGPLPKQVQALVDAGQLWCDAMLVTRH